MANWSVLEDSILSLIIAFGLAESRMEQDTLLLPNLDNAVPPAGDDHGRVDGMPRAGNGRSIVMSTVFLQQLAPPPIPKVDLAIAVTAGQEATVGADGNVTGISRDGMAGELLLSLESEAILGLIYHDLIVKTLSSPVLQGRVERHDGNRVHGRVGDVFDGNTNVPFPHQNLLIV